MRRHLAGTRPLVRLALRRDRVMIPVVLLVIWVMSYYTAVAMKDLYPDRAALVAANAVGNASTGVVAMYGHVYHLDSVGGLGANKMAMINFVSLAFLVIAIVRRHTRGEEESGRFEMVGATPVARHAPLAAAVILGSLTSLIAGLGTTLSVLPGGWPAGGSLMYGLALAGVGLSFTGITAISVQLSASNRTCGFWAFGALGVSFVLRMLADVGWNRPIRFLSWASPLGWAQQVRAFDGDRAWALLVPACFFLATVAVAVRLQSRRDLDAGFLPERPGHSGSTIGGPLALAWRLQRPTLLGWLISYAVLAVLMGGIEASTADLLQGNSGELLRKMGGVGALNDVYLTMVGGLAALATAAFGVGTVLRIRAEETGGRLEPVLATAATRMRVATSHLVLAGAGSVVLSVIMGLVSSSVHWLAGGSSGWWREAAPSLGYLPAVWVMIGITVLVIGWVPTLDWLGWALLGWVIFVAELGALLKLPNWLLQASPFAHLAKLPVDTMDWAAALWLVLLAVALTLVGLLGLRRRDIPVA